jgi:hypothetical protein
VQRFQGLVVFFLLVIILELAVIAVRLPLAPARAQGGGPIPVVIADPIGGECPGLFRNCARVDQGGALRVSIYR